MGTFEEAEQDMVERVFRLGDRPVNALMTITDQILSADLEDSAEENRNKMMDSAHSRFPVCQGGWTMFLASCHTDIRPQSGW